MNILSVLHYPVFGGPHNRNAQVAGLLRAEGVNTTLVLPEEAESAAARVRAQGCDTLLLPLARLRKSLDPGKQIQLLSRLSTNHRRAAGPSD